MALMLVLLFARVQVRVCVRERMGRHVRVLLQLWHALVLARSCHGRSLVSRIPAALMLEESYELFTHYCPSEGTHWGKGNAAGW